MSNENNEKIETKTKKQEELKKITHDKIRGKVIIFNPEKSEFAKNLNLKEKGEYSQKQK